MAELLSRAKATRSRASEDPCTSTTFITERYRPPPNAVLKKIVISFASTLSIHNIEPGLKEALKDGVLEMGGRNTKWIAMRDNSAIELTDEQEQQMCEWIEAKKRKDFRHADPIRDRLMAQGIDPVRARSCMRLPSSASPGASSRTNTSDDGVSSRDPQVETAEVEALDQPVSPPAIVDTHAAPARAHNTYAEETAFEPLADPDIEAITSDFRRAMLPYSPARYPNGFCPAMFVCPITGRLMADPVFDASGVTYERSAIEAWRSTKGGDVALFPRHGDTPFDQAEVLVSTLLTQNVTLRNNIEHFKETGQVESLYLPPHFRDGRAGPTPGPPSLLQRLDNDFPDGD